MMLFRHSDPLNLFAEFSVHSNADYGDFFGSTTLTLRIEDEVGSTVVQESAAGHNLGEVTWRGVLDFGFRAPAGLSPGSYTAFLELELHNGRRQAAKHHFQIPGALL